MFDNKKIKRSFKKLKDEMTDHKDSINENTNEINIIHTHIEQLEEMVYKLREIIDEQKLKTSEFIGEEIMKSEDFSKIVLTPKESEIFVYLYEKKGDLADYNKIARNLGITEEIVRKQISSMISKGIPLVKKYFDHKVYIGCILNICL